MAIRPSAQYPGQIDTTDSANYPHGKARNRSAPDVFDGTPWERAFVNDLFGMQQAILGDADITPSDVPDTVQASQYLEGIKRLDTEAATRNTFARLLSEFESINVGSIGTFVLGVSSYTHQSGDLAGRTFVVAVAPDGLIRYSLDGGDTWAGATHTPTEVIRHVVADDFYFWAITDEGGVSRAPVTDPSTFTAITTGIGSVQLFGGVYSPVQGWLVVVGAGGGIWTGDADAYTSRTSGSSETLRAADIDRNAAVVMACGGTDIVRSLNGGATWSRVFSTGNDLRDITCDFATGWWFAIGASGLHVSKDGGETWTTQIHTPGSGVRGVLGVLATFHSESSSGFGNRVRMLARNAYSSGDEFTGDITWRSAANEVTRSHPIHFDVNRGQFWIVGFEQNTVWRSKRAPVVMRRAQARHW